jgi:hypothetical protein
MPLSKISWRAPLACAYRRVGRQVSGLPRTADSAIPIEAVMKPPPSKSGLPDPLDARDDGLGVSAPATSSEEAELIAAAAPGVSRAPSR